VAPPAGARYLRLLFEQILASDLDWAGGPETLAHAGRALVAVGEIGPGEVRDLQRDLALAIGLRQPSPDPAGLAEAVASASAPTDRRHDDADPSAAAMGFAATSRPVATGANRFATPEGALVVEYISFGADGATLVETVTVEHDGTESASRRNRRIGSWPTISHEPVRGLPHRSPRWPSRSRGESAPGPTRAPAAPRGAAPGVPPRGRPIGPGREQLRILDDQGREYRRGPGEGRAGGGGWRWAGALEPTPPADVRWIELSLGEAPPARLDVTAPAGVTHGRPHGRSPAEAWLVGTLHATVATCLRHGARPDLTVVRAGVAALVALDHLAPSDPLVTQVDLLESRPAGGDDLDAGIGGPLAGRQRKGSGRVATLPLARVMQLGDRTARLDVAVVDDRGLHVSGWFGPWPSGEDPADTGGWDLSGFDDRHNHYVGTVTDRQGGPAGADVTWHLVPALDPAARSFRLVVAGPVNEAPVEIVVE
jgi:hypothetical protein